jgi:mycofactocin precursor
MPEPTVVSAAAPAVAVTASTTTDSEVADLIEDVSIDGMCGVY